MQGTFLLSQTAACDFQDCDAQELGTNERVKGIKAVLARQMHDHVEKWWDSPARPPRRSRGTLRRAGRNVPRVYVPLSFVRLPGLRRHCHELVIHQSRRRKM